MKKNTIRLNESQLRRIVKESVKRALKENDLGQNLITDPNQIYSVLTQGDFEEAIVTMGNGKTIKVVMSGSGVPEYYDANQYGTASCGWHTFYCPNLADLHRGMIKQVEIL